MGSTSYVLSFRIVFFYLVTTGWIFDIRLCENSINQSISLYPIIQYFSVDCPMRLLFVHPTIDLDLPILESDTSMFSIIVLRIT